MSRGSNRRDGEAGWFASLVGAVVLILGGFALGLVAGVVSEDPDLVVGHLAGRGERVPWQPDSDSGLASSQDLEAPAGEPTSGSVEGPAAALPLAAEGSEADRGLPPVAAAPRSARRDGSTDREPVAAARPAPRAAPGRTGFAIQVGAFSDEGAADRIYRQLQSKGFDAYIIPASRSRDGRSRVRVGPVASKADAEALASRLKNEERLPTWVLAEGGS